jgi:hypothetical protein
LIEWCAPAYLVLLVGIVALMVWAIRSSPPPHRHNWGAWQPVKEGPLVHGAMTTGFFLLQERRCETCQYVERTMEQAH